MRDYEYPIYFLDNTCVHCGGEQTIEAINKFGFKEKTTNMYPISRMVCRKCRQEYFIKWKSSKRDQNLDVPIPSSRNNIDRFINIVSESNRKYMENK